MYRIKCIDTDGEEHLLLELRDADLMATSAKIEEGLNKTGTLTFELPPDNPNYNTLKKLESEVIVTDLDGDVEIFRGRCVSDEKDFYNIKRCLCEGSLAYLLDSKQEPYLYTGSISGFIKMLLDKHNSKVPDRQKVYLGNITVIDPNNYIRRESEKDYASPLSIIQEKIVKTYGGLLKLRRTNGKNYLDYLADFPESDQVIRFGENLLDLKEVSESDPVCTVIVPLGAENEETGERLKINTVNGGKDYLVNAALLNKYGWIENIVEFDDVTLPENLKKKGQEYLEECANIPRIIELSAVDCRLLSMDVRRIEPGMQVRVISEPHGLDAYFLCTSKSTDLLNPENDTLVLGNEFITYTGTADKTQKEIVEKIEAGDKTLAQEIQDARDEFNEAVENSTGLYYSEVKQSDGSTKTYYHNKKNLNDSDIIMLFSTAGFSVTADGGKNWHGLTVDGKLISDILNTNGVNANWIKTGSLNADLITTGKINADLIKTGTINADLIKSGTVNADLIKTGSINADLIKTGTINADLIKTGTLTADLVKAGVLSDANGKSTWDLDTGNVTLCGNLVQTDETGARRLEVKDYGMNFFGYNGRDNKVGHIGTVAVADGKDEYGNPKWRWSVYVDCEQDGLIHVGNMYFDSRFPDGYGTNFLGAVNFEYGLRTKRGLDMYNTEITNIKDAKTGKAVFSDGSYLQFKNGILVGGKTADGGTI